MLCIIGIFKGNIQPYNFRTKTGYYFTSTCINLGESDWNEWNMVDFFQWRWRSLSLQLNCLSGVNAEALVLDFEQILYVFKLRWEF